MHTTFLLNLYPCIIAHPRRLIILAGENAITFETINPTGKRRSLSRYHLDACPDVVVTLNSRT